MTAAQLAVNSRALMAAADRLTRAGFDGDAYRFVEHLLVNALADGYRALEPAPPLRGPGANPAVIAKAKQVAAQAVAAAKAARGERHPDAARQAPHQRGEGQ